MLQEKSVIIELTKRCNLHCRYCDQKHISSDMSINVLTQILEEEIRSREINTHLSFDLYGGEPFLRFDLIKEVVNKVRESGYNDSIFIITNGTLVHGEIQQYLLENRDIIKCCLSLDGTKKTHDYNRFSSYDRIDIDYFAKYFSDTPISLTITKQTISSLAEDIIFCHEKGFEVNCGFDSYEDWKSINPDEYEKQLAILVEYYRLNPKINRSNIVPTLVPPTPDNIGKINWCSGGRNTIAYAVDGSHHLCQLFLDSDSPVIFSETKDVIEHNMQCYMCPVVHICPTCFAINYINTGDYMKKDRSLCNFRKISYHAASYLNYLLWTQGEFEMTNELLSLILNIQENFR